MLSTAIAACCALVLLPAPPRHPPPRLLFDWLRSVGPDFEADPLSADASAAIDGICQTWELKCEIGSEVARSLGGSGTLAKAQSSTVELSLRLRFTLDEGYIGTIRARPLFSRVGRC